MKSTARRDRKASTPPARKSRQRAGGGPLSVTLTAELRARLAAHAKRRELKVATLARVFLHEHVTEMDDAVELSKSEEWQRAQAWATWEKIKAGDVEEVTLAQLREDARSVMAGPPPRSVRRR